MLENLQKLVLLDRRIFESIIWYFDLEKQGLVR